MKKTLIPTGNALDGLPALSLSAIDGGALEQQWQYNLQKVLDNIRDPATDPEQKREITIKFTIEPVFDRDQANMIFGFSAKLAEHRKGETALFIGQDKRGRATVTEVDPEQPGLFGEGDEGHDETQ